MATACNPSFLNGFMYARMLSGRGEREGEEEERNGLMLSSEIQGSRLIRVFKLLKLVINCVYKSCTNFNNS